MAIIEYRTTPTPSEKKWFGLMGGVFFCVLAGLFVLRGHPEWSRNMLFTGAGFTAVYYVVPPLKRWIFALWMTLAYPIGWTISHVLLGILYYLVMTPIGLVLRLTGRDSMHRRLDKSAATYWTPHQPAKNKARYFQQF